MGGGHSGAVLRPLGGLRAGGIAAAAIRQPDSGQHRHLSKGEHCANMQADTGSEGWQWAQSQHR